jgi:hypothetical protein
MNFAAAIISLVAAVALSLLTAQYSFAKDPDITLGGEAMDIHAVKKSSGTQSSASSSSSSPTKSNPNAPVYAWRTGCGGTKSVQGGDDSVCGAPCPPGEIYMERWQVYPPPARRTPASACMSPAQAAAAQIPQVTPGMVSEAFEKLPMPKFKSQVQPANKTLVNFDTIFYSTARAFTRDITLLGQTVHLRITPSRFIWAHGDGTTTTTRTAGAKYPRKDIVYRYQKAHVTVKHRLTIEWSARWRQDGNPWRDVEGTATSTGGSTALRISEAVPVLSGQGH